MRIFCVRLIRGVLGRFHEIRKRSEQQGRCFIPSYSRAKCFRKSKFTLRGKTRVVPKLHFFLSMKTPVRSGLLRSAFISLLLAGVDRGAEPLAPVIAPVRSLADGPDPREIPAPEIKTAASRRIPITFNSRSTLNIPGPARLRIGSCS